MVYEGITRLSDTLETAPAADEKWTYSDGAPEWRKADLSTTSGEDLARRKEPVGVKADEI
jgi:hypothetical protein